MSKYEKYNPRSRQAERPWDVHPIWRGIGCIMMILIPILSYAAAVLLVEENLQQKWLPIPREFAQAVTIPMIGTFPYLYANLLVAAVLSLIGFGILTVLYSFIYSLLGPSRYGPLDSPPVRSAPEKAKGISNRGGRRR